ncbi:hypothetical protein JXA05_03365 [Candidatus Peregrinibacteria bacterium]|nr:hypothetical protein [Candidatus Peregrinibacteria bacterium]
MLKNKTFLKAALWNLVLMHRIMGRLLKQLMVYFDEEGNGESVIDKI